MTKHSDDGWIKASRSDQTGNCVEMRRGVEGVQVRDSKNPTGAALSLSRQQFLSWLAGAQDGDFDALI